MSHWVKCSSGLMPEEGTDVITAVAIDAPDRRYAYSIERREEISGRFFWVNDEYGPHEEHPDCWRHIEPPT